MSEVGCPHGHEIRHHCGICRAKDHADAVKARRAAEREPVAAIELLGSNGYNLKVARTKAGTVEAVIVGASTGKRHAVVKLGGLDLDLLAEFIAQDQP